MLVNFRKIAKITKIKGMLKFRALQNYTIVQYEWKIAKYQGKRVLAHTNEVGRPLYVEILYLPLHMVG